MSTTSQAMPAVATAGFDPSAVNETVTIGWCLSQNTQCRLICYDTIESNSCDYADLTYECTCSNGTDPDCTAFMNTLPYLICQETFSQCIANDPVDASAEAQCNANEQCGTRNAQEEYNAYEAASTASSNASNASSSSSSSSRSASSLSPPSSSPSPTSSRPPTSSPPPASSSLLPASTTSSTSPFSSVATTSTPPPTALHKTKAGLPTGVLVGIIIGCVLGGILLAIIGFCVYRRHRRKRNANHGTRVVSAEVRDPGNIVIHGHDLGKPELVGDGQATGNKRWGPVQTRSELTTQANRHEMEDTQVSGTLNGPWSPDVRAELDGWHR